jgi:3D (Asp-Asp-Asp) domain-containing protein
MNENKFTAFLSLLTFGLVILIAFLQWTNAKVILRNQELRNEIQRLKEEQTSNLSPKIETVASYTRRMNISAYCPCQRCCGKYSDGVTATGKDAYSKGVAVDPKVIPLGTKIHIPGYGTVEADDVGGAIKGDRLDVRFKTHQEALEWGRQFKEVTIFRE